LIGFTVHEVRILDKTVHQDFRFKISSKKGKNSKFEGYLCRGS